MIKFALPEELKGEWIWKSSDSEDSHVFFRKEIALESIGAEAELWISAHGAYHIFVNGRHIGFGPPPSSREKTYADLYNLTFYLQTGLNVIGILSYGTGVQ